jgi:hypothetical protein
MAPFIVGVDDVRTERLVATTERGKNRLKATTVGLAMPATAPGSVARSHRIAMFAFQEREGHVTLTHL